MSSASNITAKYDEERSRAHEQSQLVYLQGQIDELRRLIKDQTNKYNWVIEQTRKTEAAAVQVQGLFERHREETLRTIERSRHDIIELRKEIATALLKIDEGIKPLREMQAQIQQLADARKQDRDQIFPWFSRIEELEQKTMSLQNQIREAEERQRQMSMQLDRLRDADAVALQEARRVGEEFHIEKQSLRRQAVEAQQLVGGIHEVLKELDARIGRLDERYENLHLVVESLPDQIVEVGSKYTTVETEIKRIELISTDWFMMNQERLEDLRQQSNEQISELHDVDQQHLTQLTAWLERLDGWVRELEQRIEHSVVQLESSQKSHIARLIELEHRELRTIRGLANAFREEMATVEAEHVRLRSE